MSTPAAPVQHMLGVQPNGREIWLLEDGSKLVGVHPLSSDCLKLGCIIHSPTEHHMRGWPLSIEEPGGMMQRRCPHRVYHPDPDTLAYWRRQGRGGPHTCDGCCQP